MEGLGLGDIKYKKGHFYERRRVVCYRMFLDWSQNREALRRVLKQSLQWNLLQEFCL